MADNKNTFQIIWGVALVLMGVGVIFRFHQLLPELIKKYDYFSPGVLRFTFYLLAALLIAGGIKKLISNSRKMENNQNNRSMENN